MILIFKREKLSKVVVNKPYEVRFDFLVVLVFYFHVFWRVRASCTISNIQYSKIPTSAGFPENFLLPTSALASQQRCCSSRKLVILWLVSSCHCFGHCFCCFFFSCSFSKSIKPFTASWLAQLVERQSAVRKVEGSSPRPDQHSGS